MQQVFASWSGGKDSCLACYQAGINCLEVTYLLNMITEDGKRSWTHGQSAELLQVQAQAIGIPLLQRRTTMNNYENEFKDVLLALKQKGVSGGVFGDIDFHEHRKWIERICQPAKMIPYLPLWGQAQEKVLRDFIEFGFEAVVVANKADLLGEEWLGQKIDQAFLSHLQQTGIQLCGEAGEYHTFVTDGPLFKKRLEITETNKVLRDGHWFLEILQCELKAK